MESTDGGETFGTPRPVSQPDRSSRISPAVRSGEKGRVLIFCYKVIGTASTEIAFVSRPKDSLVFSAERVVGPTVGVFGESAAYQGRAHRGGEDPGWLLCNRLWKALFFRPRFFQQRHLVENRASRPQVRQLRFPCRFNCPEKCILHGDDVQGGPFHEIS